MQMRLCKRATSCASFICTTQSYFFPCSHRTACIVTQVFKPQLNVFWFSTTRSGTQAKRKNVLLRKLRSWFIGGAEQLFCPTWHTFRAIPPDSRAPRSSTEDDRCCLSVSSQLKPTSPSLKQHVVLRYAIGSGLCYQMIRVCTLSWLWSQTT